MEEKAGLFQEARFRIDKDQRQYRFRHRFTFQWIFTYR